MLRLERGISPMRRALISALALSFALGANAAAAEGITATQKRALQVWAETGALAKHCPRARVNHEGLGAMLLIAGIDPAALTAGGPIGAAAFRAAYEADEAGRKLAGNGAACAAAKILYGPDGTSGPGMMDMD